MRRATDEQDDTPAELGIGSTSANLDADEEHEAHVFLYVPDFANKTGWSTHRVPERREERSDRRPLGFRR